MNEENKKNEADIVDEEIDYILKTIKRDKEIKKYNAEDDKKQVLRHTEERNLTEETDGGATRVSVPCVKPKITEKTIVRDFPENDVKPYFSKVNKDKVKEENIVCFDDFEKTENTGSKRTLQRNKNNRAENHRETSGGFLGSAYAGIIKLLLYVAFVCVSVYFLSTTIINIGNDMFAFVKEDKDITVSIPADATTSDVAEILEENGVINNAFVFEKYTNLRMRKAATLSGKYVSGEVVLNSNMNYDTLRKKIALQNIRQTLKVTIPEGLTVNETIDILVKSGVGTKEGYTDAIQNYEYKNKIVQILEDDGYSDYRKDTSFSYRLEGYLFPDTYEFYNDENPVSVIDKFLINFERKFQNSFFERANEMGYTMDEIITIASLIEKEGGNADEYANISSVFHNRLKNKGEFPFLNSDATIQYALSERKSVLSGNDTDYDHPYNTYLNKGLPPGPICNPGYEAIVAALFPADTDYNYFVTGKDGVTVFAKTYDEHRRNVDRVLK